MNPLAARTVEHAVVYPTVRVDAHADRLFMGVYDAAGGYVEGTVLDRRAGTTGAPVPPALFRPVDRPPVPEAIYAGPLYYHFGHFLLESLARAWYAQQQPELPLVWTGAHHWRNRGLTSWQHEILEVLGLRNPARLTTEPLGVGLLHVPDIGYRYDDWFHPDHAAFLGRHRGPAQVPGERLWLSRSRLGSDARDLNAEPTERRLAAAGWTVVHPETLTIREQLAHLCRAEVVAGEEGSAFHLLALLEDLSGKRLRVLRRHGEEHPNMRTIGDARAIDQTFHTLRDEHVVRAKGRVVTKVNPTPSEILDLLEVPVAPTRAHAPDPLLLHVVDGLAPARLLEVGAATPALSQAATAELRVAVSPRFDGDPRALTAAGVELYELDVAQYADAFHGSRGEFDVIRIAGPDLTSVLGDFRASRRLAHAGTTWVLGAGDVAARAAVTVRTLHPAFAARRVLVRRTPVYLLTRSGKPARESEFAELTDREVARRARLLPLTRLRPVRPVRNTRRQPVTTGG